MQQVVEFTERDLTQETGKVQGAVQLADPSGRCRLVLVVPPVENAHLVLAEAIAGGDVASVILMRGELTETAYAAHVEKLVPVTSEFDTAVLVDNDSQSMGRAEADGLFVTGGIEMLGDALARFSPKRIVGYGSVKTRHAAMNSAELNPDFLFLGKLDGDIKPEAHPKNLEMANWCSELMEVPVVVMGGSSLESVVEVSASGADFVALGLAVFSHLDGPKEAVRLANALLDQHAPRLVDEA
jgi:thiamine-phosphate pyrophosphorylase